MRLRCKKKTDPKRIARFKNKVRIRKRVIGTAECPRMTIFKSRKHLYVQLIDDREGNTLASASTLRLEKTPLNIQVAEKIGKEIAKEAERQKIKSVVFDRNGYVYHGRVKAVADAARAAGLNF